MCFMYLMKICTVLIICTDNHIQRVQIIPLCIVICINTKYTTKISKINIFAYLIYIKYYACVTLNLV